jgi:hypothetical protein
MNILACAGVYVKPMRGMATCPYRFFFGWEAIRDDKGARRAMSPCFAAIPGFFDSRRTWKGYAGCTSAAEESSLHLPRAVARLHSLVLLLVAPQRTPAL